MFPYILFPILLMILFCTPVILEEFWLEKQEKWTPEEEKMLKILYVENREDMERFLRNRC